MTERLLPGTVFARRYEVLRCIGMGGMGAVYEVVHRGTRRHHALKVLLPTLVADTDARERFAQEACITAEVDSEHIVDVSDAAVDEVTGSPYIVMELLKGYSLGERLEQKRKFSLTEVVEIITQIARALEKTHAAGIVHRDLKPDNIFATTAKDGQLQIKIVDFGIAKVVASATSASRNTVNIGTPLYMAPEQLDGSMLDGRADLFSLAHIAFELLIGESYWEPEVRSSPGTLAMLRIMDRGLPEHASVRARRAGVRVGPTFDAWFTRAVARQPHERFRCAMELVEEFALAVRLPTMTLDMGLQTGSRGAGHEARPLAPAPRPQGYLVAPRVQPQPVQAVPPPISAPGAQPPFALSAVTEHHPGQRVAIALTAQRSAEPVDMNPLLNPKATGGPGVWGMVTPRTKATRMTWAAAGAALLAILSLGGLLVYLQVSSSRASRGGDSSAAIDEPSADVSSTLGTSGSSASGSSASGSSASEGSSVVQPVPYASATSSVVATASATGAGTASSRPFVPPPRLRKPPTARDICLKAPQRCR